MKVLQSIFISSLFLAFLLSLQTYFPFSGSLQAHNSISPGKRVFGTQCMKRINSGDFVIVAFGNKCVPGLESCVVNDCPEGSWHAPYIEL